MPEARPHPTLTIQAAGAADIGRARSHNEDAVLVRPDLRLWVVADGAGGHNAGNVASALAVAAIANQFESTEADHQLKPEVDRFGIPSAARRLSAAVRRANHEVIEVSKASKKYGGMGSTVVAATVASRSPMLYVAHVGDSRCYRLRDGRLEQLTVDHSLITEIVEAHPDLGDETIAKLPRKVVTRALGMEENIRVSVRWFAIAAEDIVLLCSDGLTGELPDEHIRRTLALRESPAELCDRLITLANEAGGRDNIAALVLSFDVGLAPAEELAALLEPDPEPPPPPAPEPLESTLVSIPRPEGVSAPEILLLGIESDVDPEEAQLVRVVPEGSATSGLFRAIGDLLPPRRPPRNPLGFCGYCKAELVAEAIFCPRCGMRRSPPGGGS